MDINYFLSTFKKNKQKNKQTHNKNKKSKTRGDYEANLGDCLTFPRSVYINYLYNSSPHSPIARYTCVLTVSTLDF